MGEVNLSLLVLLFSMVFAVIGLSIRIFQLLAYPDVKDFSPPKASTSKGVLYAFTVGMLPWKKESAKLHLLVYVRGIFLHLGIFTFTILLFMSIFVNFGHLSNSWAFYPTLGLGFLAGVAALIARFTDRNLRAISKLDDYISLALVIMVLLTGLIFVINVTSRTVFWGVVSVFMFIPPVEQDTSRCVLLLFQDNIRRYVWTPWSITRYRK